MDQQRGPGQVHSDAPDELGCARPRQLLLDDEVLGRAQPAAAVLRRPRDADPAAARQGALPLPQERDLGLQVVEPRRQADAVLPRQVRLQPRPHLLAQRLLLGGGGEVH